MILRFRPLCGLFLLVVFTLFLVFPSSFAYSKSCQIAGSVTNADSKVCDASVAAFSKELNRGTCLADCQSYINQLDQPEKLCPSTSEVQSLCQPSLQSYLDYMKQPENLLALATACTRGEIEGVQLAFDQVELYKNFAVRAAEVSLDALKSMPQSLQSLFKQQAEKANDFSAWAKRCDKKWECRSAIARSVIQYSERTPAGVFKISDTQLKAQLKNKSMLTLISEAKASKAQARNQCLSAIDRYSVEWTQRSFSNGKAREWARYNTIKSNNPECLARLDILPPEATPSLAKDKGLLESLGIKLQCYSPAKTRELICMHAVAFILDPLNLLGGVGGAAAKIAAKAGLKGAASSALRSAGKAFGLLGEGAELSRLKSAETLIKRSLSESESQALLNAHYVGVGEKGKNGQWASVSNYTDAQIAQKYKLLRAAGFTENESRLLMQKGIAGLDAKEASEAASKVASLRSGLKSASAADNPLAAMGLGPNATLKDFDEAYKAMARVYHPDKLKLISGLSNEEKKAAQEIFAQINGLKENREALQRALDGLSASQKIAADPAFKMNFQTPSAPSQIQISDYANLRNMADSKPDLFIKRVTDFSSYSPSTSAGAQIATDALLTGVSSANIKVQKVAIDTLEKYVPQIAQTRGFVAEEARDGFYRSALNALNESTGVTRERLKVVLRQSLTRIAPTTGKSSGSREKLENILGISGN